MRQFMKGYRRSLKWGFNQFVILSLFSGMGMEVCCTLGMLNEDQAKRLKEAGLTAYNHNLDTSREFYPKVKMSHDTHFPLPQYSDNELHSLTKYGPAPIVDYHHSILRRTIGNHWACTRRWYLGLLWWYHRSR